MTPETEEELARVIRTAAGRLSILGGGTRGMAGGGVPLTTAALRGITLYEPGALTLVVRAGTPLTEVETALAAEGQRLAFEPMDHRGVLGTRGTPTIGGVVAGNVSGPRRIAVGACRDFLLGVRFVDGQGRSLRNGGRVMKNVTGYDLVKLMAGSRGTLGVLTEVALKVLPVPQAAATLEAAELEDGRAIAALCAALGTPFEVSGAAHLPGPDGARTILRLEGFAASVAYRASELATALRGFGDFAVSGDMQVWDDLRHVAPFQGRAGDVWRLSVRPTAAPGIVAALPGAEAVYDWGGGLIWLLVPEGVALDGTAIRQVVAQAGGGHATLVRGEDAARFQPQPPAIAALEERLRRAFDPRGLFAGGSAA